MRVAVLNSRPYWALCLLFVALILTVFKPWVHGIDGAGYYSWLRSFVLEGNIDTLNEVRHFESNQQPDIQANVWSLRSFSFNEGKFANHYPIGSAILWAPFFLASHCLVAAANAVGIQISSDGYSQPYILFSTLGSEIWAFAGLTIIYSIAAGMYGRFSAGLATATVWMATPLIFYMYIHPAMSHANDVFVNAVFVLAWLATRKNQTWRYWLMLGVASGLAAMVRPQNALLLVFPCIEIAILLFGRFIGKSRLSVAGICGRGAALIAGAVAAFLPQMLVWKAVFGSYLVLNAQKLSIGLGFDFTGRNILNVLISSDRGLFIWSPIAVPALIGIYYLYRSDRRFALLLLSNFCIQLYLIGSWAVWSGGISFGPRFFLNSVPAFAIGLSALLSKFEKRVGSSGLLAICSAFVLWNLGLMAQYVLQLVPRAGEVSLRLMISNQFLAVPGKIFGLVVRAVCRT